MSTNNPMTAPEQVASKEGGHPPGPWRYTADEFGDFTIQPRDHKLAIAAVVNGAFRHIVGETSEQEANARLIAAAPELLKACRRALVTFKAQGESVRPGNVLGALEAALSLASPRP